MQPVPLRLRPDAWNHFVQQQAPGNENHVENCDANRGNGHRYVPVVGVEEPIWVPVRAGVVPDERAADQGEG